MYKNMYKNIIAYEFCVTSLLITHVKRKIMLIIHRLNRIYVYMYVCMRRRRHYCLMTR